MLILISDPFAPDLPEKLAPFGEVTDDKGRLAEAEVALVRSKTKCTAQWMDEAPGMKLIIRGGVGLDNVDLGEAEKRGIQVHNTPAASAVAVAELTLALMLALPNHLVKGHNAMAGGKWIKKELKRTELFRKTLGLLGVGRIGTEVARRCAAFGMDVLAYDPYVEKHEIAAMVGLEEMLGKADYISLHMPLLDSTRGMVNADLIGRMKEGVRIVNCGRGGCIDEADMKAALESGKVAGYGTDVWLSDPPAPDCPLLSAPNTVMLPHIGASTKENLLRIGDIIVEILTEYTSK